MRQLCQFDDFPCFARIGDEQQQVILLQDTQVSMLCFAGMQKYGRNAGRAKGCSNIHGYLPCFTHAGSYQFAFFTVYLFYDKFYRLFVCVRYRDIQYGLRFFLQKLLNGCYHCLNFDLWIISLQISVIFHKRQ